MNYIDEAGTEYPFKAKPPTYSAKRKRKPGEINVDRRTRWAYRLWIKLTGKKVKL